MTIDRRTAVLLAFALLVPAAFYLLVVASPPIDEHWEHHPAHFWLVLAAAAISVSLGYSVSVMARRRQDARLYLASLAFITAALFLGLHALATPGVLLGKNAGFELATPVGLVIAAGFAAASALELKPSTAHWIMRHANLWLALVGGLGALWAILSLGEIWPLAQAPGVEELNGWQTGLAVVGVTLYTLAALGYARLYRRRRADILLAVTLAFALLAEAMLVIVWARNWRLSWWEWHLLMLAAFATIALSARREWYEERFSPLYLEETLAGARDVSVLFADLQGYTSFSERNTPAVVAEMLRTYFERLVPLLEGLGGEVHQLIGDAIMVVFNKEGDQPDHAVRAADAGLQLQREAADAARPHPEWPRFRVGVNSGEVVAGVLGARGHRTHGVVGDTVNLAARLEGHAPVGHVVVGAETARRLPESAVLEPLPQLRVKGKAELVEAYVVERL